MIESGEMESGKKLGVCVSSAPPVIMGHYYPVTMTK
jgi:hypothetical protein